MNKLSDFGSLLNLPSVHLDQKKRIAKQDSRIHKQTGDIQKQKMHKAKVDNMVKRNATRSQKRVANAMKRLPAEELVDLLGPVGLLATGGFVAYDLADMCYEINDANDLLELIGQPLIENPISQNCDKVERGSSYVIQNVKEGWTVVVTKTKNGWQRVVGYGTDVIEFYAKKAGDAAGR